VLSYLSGGKRINRQLFPIGETKMPLNLTRSLLTIILPGMVALGPWMLLAVMYFPKLNVWYKEFAVPIHVAAFGVSVIFGLAFEEIGNYLEKRWDASLAKRPEPVFEDTWVSRDWYHYLRSNFGDGEPIAYRYISRKVTSLYFELGMMCATPVALVAVASIAALLFPGASWLAAVIGTSAALAWLVLRISAGHTHALLCEVRHFLANPQNTSASNGLA
jgi:hypothetical protein